MGQPKCWLYTLDSMQSNPDLNFARDLIKRAGEIFLADLKQPYKTVWKPDNTPVTTIDIEINNFINNAISKAYPNDRIHSEELPAKNGTQLTWVVDPLDGTQALGILPTSTICISRLDDGGLPLFGLVYNPQMNQLFEVQKGQPALLNGKEIRASSKADLKGSYVFLGSRMAAGPGASNGQVYDKLEAKGAKILNARSLAFGCCMVACGKAEGAFLGVKTTFEAAAIKLLAEQAGGKVTDLYGKPHERLDTEMDGLIVSNGHLHDSLLNALAK